MKRISPIESFNGEMALYFPGNYKQAKEYGLTYWFEEPKVMPLKSVWSAT